jgi:peptidoglycan/LPS O-acetylase OafA/YrhL
VSGAGPKYRADIDGLRAIAVAAVVGFHAVPLLFPGGFAGVDIFFVISGYLITSVIAGDLAAGTFTLRNFYLRRVRRIFPALAAMLVVAAVIGWMILLPDEFRNFGKHLFAGAAFISNLALSREGGYFHWSAHAQPLLHLWSLGVEEQFYFVWPLFLAMLWKTSPRTRMAMLIAAMLLSFALNVWALERYPVYTFYLPFTRLWELAIGSVLAVSALRVSRRVTAELASWSGALLLVASVAFVREHSFPGVWALLPTLGAALVIAAGPQASFNRIVLANRAFVFVGLISYPLYLWHWPLLTFARIYTGVALAPIVTFALIALSVIVAILTYRFVERPIRGATSFSPRLMFVCAVLVVIAGFGLAARFRAIDARLTSPAINDLITAANDWTYPHGENFGKTRNFVRATEPGTEQRAVLFIGDSHLEQYWPRLHVLPRGPELRFATNGGCPPLPGLEVERGDVCRRYLEFAFREMHDPRVKTVVFGAFWGNYLRGREHDPAVARFENEMRALLRDGKRVFVVLDGPSSPKLDPRGIVSRRDGVLRSEVALRSEMTSPASIRDAAIRAGAEVIDPMETFCANGVCPGTIDGRAIYRDMGHLRPFYVRDHATFMDRVLR